MWFEIIPAFGIVMAAMTIPHVCVYGLNKIVNGNAFRRDTSTPFNRTLYVRDGRLSGDTYKANGLEAIPDE